MDEIVINVSNSSRSDIVEISQPMQRFMGDLLDEIIKEDMKQFYQEAMECKKQPSNQNRN